MSEELHPSDEKEMNKEFIEKMKGLCEKTVDDIVAHFKDEAVEAYLFGSMATGTNDALSDIDIWITFENDKIRKVIEDRMASYAKFGQIVLLHEIQNNFPLDGIQTAIIYKIEGELIKVDFYLCPLSSARVPQDSKILFEKKQVETGDIIPETKRTHRDISDRVTFFISMCFNGIKKIIREDTSFMDFLIREFQKYKKEIPELSNISHELSFDTIRDALTILATISNQEQKVAIHEINQFMVNVESAAAT